jgi:membrane-associated PAP2 superfamily phosphatase
MSSKRAFILMIAGSFLAILVFEYSGIDLAIQDHFYDFQAHTWLVDQHAPVPRFFFYNFPKILLVIYGVSLLIMGTASGRFRKSWFLPKRTALYLLCSLSVIPIMIGIGKSQSWVYCPSEITRYGGPGQYRRVFDSLPKNVAYKDRGRCFPAGHASGGAALISLYFAARTRRQQRLALLVPLFFGGAMAVYQMLKGAHYMSHTAVTFIVAWGISLMLANSFALPRPKKNAFVNGPVV